MTAQPSTGDAISVPPKSGVRARLLPLGLIFVVTTLAYLPTLGMYFCGYDDFNEVHRAAFEDLPNPGRMFTTSHFNTSKYRPLNRALTAAAYYWGSGDPFVFRVRNLAFHLAAVAGVYGIGLALLDSAAGAFAAALLFALHPLANQNVVGAVMTNTAAYAMMFASLLLFIGSLERSSGRAGKLALALLLSALALYTYEATLVLFVLMAFYFGARSFFGKRPMPSPSYIAGACAGILVICAGFFLARALYASGHNSVSSAGTIFGNLALYIGALLVPVDALFANSLFGFPLPSEMLSEPGLMALVFIFGIGAVSIILFVVVSLFLSRLRSGRPNPGIDWRLLFFLMAICASLLPFLVFTEHASETYLYPGAAFLCLTLALLTEKFMPAKGFRATIAILVVLFGCATFLRNQRVRACGSTALKVLSGLPLDRFRQGSWSLVLAPFPDETIPVRYGIYSYAGLGTIDPGDAQSINSAIQLATRNGQVTATAVLSENMAAACAQGPNECFWVHSDGAVEQYRKDSRLFR
jgi:hypothetical protein